MVDEPDEVVPAKCGGSGICVPGGSTVSESRVAHWPDIVITAITRPAINARPSSPAAKVAPDVRYHGFCGFWSRAMAADTSRRMSTAPNP